MEEYNLKKKQLKDAIQKIRSSEILYSIIYDIENNRFEENDFDKNKTEILKLLYHIKICRLQQYNQVDNLEEKLYEIMGENFILYIPPESELVKKLKNMYNSYY